MPTLCCGGFMPFPIISFPTIPRKGASPKDFRSLSHTSGSAGDSMCIWPCHTPINDPPPRGSIDILPSASQLVLDLTGHSMAYLRHLFFTWKLWEISSCGNSSTQDIIRIKLVNSVIQTEVLQVSPLYIFSGSHDTPSPFIAAVGPLSLQ